MLVTVVCLFVLEAHRHAAEPSVYLLNVLVNGLLAACGSFRLLFRRASIVAAQGQIHS
jgi:hypothetical protein